LEGQANWRKRDAESYLPAPPHNETGHTWHHSDTYLSLMIKYGIEDIIRKLIPNNMPAYEGKLTDEEILAALSYRKSNRFSRIQHKKDQINARANSQYIDYCDIQTPFDINNQLPPLISGQILNRLHE